MGAASAMIANSAEESAEGDEGPAAEGEEPAEEDVGEKDAADEVKEVRHGRRITERGERNNWGKC